MLLRRFGLGCEFRDDIVQLLTGPCIVACVGRFKKWRDRIDQCVVDNHSGGREQKPLMFGCNRWLAAMKYFFEHFFTWANPN